MELSALLVDDLIRLSLPAATWEEVLRRLAEDLRAAGRVHPTFEDAVVAREHTFPTGLLIDDMGVAIPHADVEHVKEAAIAIATLRAPVLFGEMGNPDQTVPVQLVFMLAIDRPDAMVGVLADLIDSFQQPGALTAILRAQSSAEVRAAFGRVLAGVVAARRAAVPAEPAVPPAAGGERR